jgi:hypothetical protein
VHPLFQGGSKGAVRKQHRATRGTTARRGSTAITARLWTLTAGRTKLCSWTSIGGRSAPSAPETGIAGNRVTRACGAIMPDLVDLQ